MGKIFYIMGKSASGKDTIYERILKECTSLSPVVLYTSRPMRNEEKDGYTYHFIDKNRFNELRNDNKIIEERTYSTQYGDWYYATVDDGQINLDISDYLMIGTLISYVKIKKYYGEDNIIPIYIESDDGDRLIRSVKREKIQYKPKYKEICRRFLADSYDFDDNHIQDAGIEKRFQNDNLDNCIKVIIEFIRRH